MAGLGRGLDALLSESRARKDRTSEEDITNSITPMPINGNSTVNTDDNISKNTVMLISIDNLVPSSYQPRKNFDEESLQELSLSIKEHGLLEPLLVKKNDDGKFEIICGERRFKAAKIAELKEVPCLVRDVLEDDAYAIALIENIQREDLNPLEQANAMLQMQSACKMTQEELAKTLGKSRTSVANYLRLNNLNQFVKDALAKGLIDMGHAKVILGLDDEFQAKVCEVVIKKSLSVRQTEAYVKALKTDDVEGVDTKKVVQPPIFKDYEKCLSESLFGAKVKFVQSGDNKGKVTLAYINSNQLEQILKVLGLTH